MKLAGAGWYLALCAALLPGPAPAQDACAELQRQGPDEFSRLAEKLAKESPPGHGVLSERLAACKLDYDTLRQRQCGKAYSSQNLEFLLRYCRFEAWSLARAQCERSRDAITPRYAAFCKEFGRE